MNNIQLKLEILGLCYRCCCSVVNCEPNLKTMNLGGFGQVVTLSRLCTYDEFTTPTSCIVAGKEKALAVLGP